MGRTVIPRTRARNRHSGRPERDREGRDGTRYHPPEDSQHLLCVEKLIQTADALAAFPAAKEPQQIGPRFIHSFAGSMLDQLPPPAPSHALYVAAPFFGNSLDGLNALTARYTPKSLHVFPAIHSGESTDLPLKLLAKTHKGAKAAPLATPGKKGALAHLKLYGADIDKETSWLCCTSANCTSAAWQGPNIEAGLTRLLPPSACHEYFVPAKELLPEGKLQYAGDDIGAGLLHCWASDTGGGIDLVVSSTSREHLPLNHVVLTVRAGSRLTGRLWWDGFRRGGSVGLWPKSSTLQDRSARELFRRVTRGEAYTASLHV